jgi:hypothetical protein
MFLPVMFYSADGIIDFDGASIVRADFRCNWSRCLFVASLRIYLGGGPLGGLFFGALGFGGGGLTTIDSARTRPRLPLRTEYTLDISFSSTSLVRAAAITTRAAMITSRILLNLNMLIDENRRCDV